MAKTKPKERARSRVLTDQEIRDLWTALDQMEKPACYARYVKLLLLTATRREEASAMRWDEIEGDAWVIPSTRYKTGLDHAIPLTDEVRALIGAKPRNTKTAPCIISSDGGKTPFSGYSKAKAALDRKIAEVRAKDEREPMPHWTLHDLRRTARTLMSSAGVSSDIAERVLGHVIPGVRRVYDRHAYAAEKRDALERLSAMVQTILHPPSGNVVPMAQKRAAEQGATSATATPS